MYILAIRNNRRKENVSLPNLTIVLNNKSNHNRRKCREILIVKTKNVAFPPKFFSLLYAINKPFNVNTTSEKIIFNLFSIHFLCALWVMMSILFSDRLRYSQWRSSSSDILREN